MAMIKVEDVSYSYISKYQKIEALKHVSCSFEAGKMYAVIGESGSGKSVTMMSVLQLVSAPGFVESGTVYLDGEEKNLLEYDTNSEKMRSVRGGRIGMIFQEPMTSLNPVLTIGYQIQENIMKHLKLAAIETHVADARTCCLHPASATHRQMNDAELAAAGVGPDLIRLSVGIENKEDILADLEQALASI